MKKIEERSAGQSAEKAADSGPEVYGNYLPDGVPRIRRTKLPGRRDFSGLCGPRRAQQSDSFARDFIPSPAPIPAGQRFLTVGVSEFNSANNPLHEFIFNPGTPQEKRISSPDPGRALITGIVDDPRLENVNAFKIPVLRGIRHTAPYFHDNSAKTLEDVAAHYAKFFSKASHGVIVLTPQDQKDIAAYMKLLD